MLAAARRWKTSCALNAISRRQNEIRWSALPLDGNDPGRGVRTHRRQSRRLGKTLWNGTQSGGEKVRVQACGMRGKHATSPPKRRICAAKTRLAQYGGAGARLVPERDFEDRFSRCGIPYRVIGGPRFYERPEIRDGPRLFARGRAGR